jgi:hypothetical protein
MVCPTEMVILATIGCATGILALSPHLTHLTASCLMWKKHKIMRAGNKERAMDKQKKMTKEEWYAKIAEEFDLTHTGVSIVYRDLMKSVRKVRLLSEIYAPKDAKMEMFIIDEAYPYDAKGGEETDNA